MNIRCEKILERLKETDKPVTASSFAEEFGVSRQVIVGDVAILRAAGYGILATSRGYRLEESTKAGEYPYVGIIACRHDQEGLKDELYTIVDFGGTIIDVTIEHAVYGELSGNLNLSSRYEVDDFLRIVREEKNSLPISSLTDGVHVHRVGCPDENIFGKIKDALAEKGILLS